MKKKIFRQRSSIIGCIHFTDRVNDVIDDLFGRIWLREGARISKGLVGRPSRKKGAACNEDTHHNDWQY